MDQLRSRHDCHAQPQSAGHQRDARHDWKARLCAALAVWHLLLRRGRRAEPAMSRAFDPIHIDFYSNEELSDREASSEDRVN